MLPTISEAFRRAIAKGRNLAPNGMPVTLERITQILGDGQVEVLGARIPVAGEGLRTLRAGQMVAVAWQQGRPVTAIAHSAKRSGAPVPLPRPTAPLVEELFIGIRPSDGIADVFLRNFDAVTPLRLDRFLAPSEISAGTLKWGPRNDRFFVQRLSRYHIFKLDREPDAPFAAGADPSDGLTLERTEDLATNTTGLATVNTNHTMQVGSLPFPPPTFVTMTPTSAPVSLVSASLDIDGALIGSFRLNLFALFAWDSVPAANFDAPSVGAGTLTYPIIADLTNGIVLLSGFATPNAFTLLWPNLIDYNNVATIDVAVFGSVSRAIPLPTVWVAANTVTFPIDPPFEGHTSIQATWQMGFSETPSTQLALVDPILVLGKALPAVQRVRGFVAWLQVDYIEFVGQTFDVANWHFFLNPAADPDRQLIPPAPPFPITPQAGAIARAPLSGADVALYAVSRPVRGLSFAPTLHRVLWRAGSAPTFFPADGGLDVGGADSPGFVTRFAGGATVQISPTLRASVGKRGLVPVLTDFLYQLDNPVVALPPKTDLNFFVDAWAFAGTTTLNTAAADFPAEATELAEVKPLADLPTGVIHPTSAGLFSLAVNNSAEVLEGLGLFEELPS